MTTRRAKIAWELRRAEGIPTSNVPAGPITEHLRALIALGFSTPALAAAAGVADATVREIAAGQHSPTRPVERIRRTTAARLTRVTPAAVFAAADSGQVVAAYGAQRRLRALQAIGWTLAHIDAELPAGTRATNVLEQPTAIMASTHRAVDAVYEMLSVAPGPSTVSRTWAARRGSPVPLAWEDIDEPDLVKALGGNGSADTVDLVAVERVVTGEAGYRDLTLTRAEVDAAVDMALQLGISSYELSTRVPLKRATIEQRMVRARSRSRAKVLVA